MKRIIGVFSLAMLVLSTFAPSFTYALEPEEEQAIEFLTNMLEEVTEGFDDNHGIASVVQSENKDRSIFLNEGPIQGNGIYDLENGLKEIIWEDIDIIYNPTLIEGIKWGATNSGDAGNNDPYTRGGGDDSQYNSYHPLGDGIGRQGPCEEGFHVPSAGEFGYFGKAACKLYEGCDDSLINDNYGYGTFAVIKMDDNYPDIGTKLGNFVGLNQIGAIWSSSYYSGFSVPYFMGWGSNGLIMYTQMSYDVPLQVLCFKNYIASKKVIFDANGGTFSGGATTETHTYNYSGSEIVPIYNIQIPDRKSLNPSQQSGWMFAGWYTTAENQTVEFDISNPQTTTAYAKWLPFNNIELEILGEKYVLMDRNLGAISNDISSTDSFGYFYQWGNNYGFKGLPPVEKRISTINDNNYDYGPGNYYMHNRFITNNLLTEISSFKNWRGGGDNFNKNSLKKGPCPEGYHIPDKFEFIDLYNNFNNFAKGSEGKEICGTKSAGECFGELFNMPKAGYIGMGVSEFNRMNIRKSGKYRSSSNLENRWPSDIGFGPNEYNEFSVGGNLYYYAQSIRCFKNIKEPEELNVKFELNNGTDDIIIKIRKRDNIDYYEPNEPKYKGYTFKERINKETGEVYDFNDLNKHYPISKNTVIQATWQKNPWYIYRTNGGVFKFGGTIATGMYDYTLLETKYVHTNNLDDNGNPLNPNTDFSYEKGLNTNQVVKIPGAKDLVFEINPSWLRWSYDDYDYLAVWSGEHPDYRANTNQSDEILGRNYWKNNWGLTGLVINNDSVTFGFYSFDTRPTDYTNLYGYYIPVNGYAYTTKDIIDDPIRSGYTFKGWFETGLEIQYNPNELVVEGKEYFAKWDPHHYTIQFDINEGTGVTNDIYVTYGEGRDLPIVTREGYIFKGWGSEDGTIFNNSIPEGTGVTTEDGVTVKLKAQWEKVEETAPSKGSGRPIVTPTKQETKTIEEEHNVADTEEQTIETTTNTKVEVTPTIKEKVERTKEKVLSRGEIAVMTNILLEVYPKLTENKSLNEVSEACENYADDQDFTKDEKKAITRLCKLSIMGIHNDKNEPLDEFLVKQKATNGEFATIMDRVVSSYNEKDLSTIKEALKKLENDDEGVVFGTVYNIFMSIKNIFN